MSNYNHNILVRIKLELNEFWIFANREIQAASGEWVNEYARGPSRRDSLTNEYMPASDIIKKGIRRSWTISSKYSSSYNKKKMNFIRFTFFPWLSLNRSPTRAPSHQRRSIRISPLSYGQHRRLPIHVASTTLCQPTNHGLSE